MGVFLLINSIISIQLGLYSHASDIFEKILTELKNKRKSRA
jgi:hypothetical protein